MNNKNLLSAALLLTGLLLAAQELAPKIIAFAERPSAVYKTGEPIRFKVWLIQPKGQLARDPEDPDKEQQIEGVKMAWELTGDGNYSKKGSFVSGKEPAVVEAALNRPGFVLLKVTAWPKGKKIVRFAGAGIDPEKIVSGTTMPADFEAYWQERIRKMRERKPEITVKDITDSYPRNYREAVKVYDVRIADGEINATGILTIPRWPGKEKMPIIITFGGASWIGARLRLDEAVARGAMVYCM